VSERSAPSFTTHPVLRADSLSDYLSRLRFIVNRFGHQHDDPSAEADPRVIGDVELIFFRGGRGGVISDRAELNCERGDIVLIPPFYVHEIRTTPEDPHENYWVHFDVSPLYERDRFVRLLSTGGLHRKRADSDPLIDSAVRLIAAAVDAASAERDSGESARPASLGISAVIEGAIRAIAAAIARSAEQRLDLSGATLSDHDRGALDRVLSWVAANLGGVIEVDDLVQAAACSRSLLFRLFQEQLGRSPMAMVRWMRLREAERLLRSTHRSVKEISALVGISSPFHLSRLVKELYGVSPQQLRTHGHAEWTP
jgi:AraC-like DNA-binding protein